MPTLDERVYRLEIVLEEFIKSVGIEFNKLYNSQMRTEAEIRELKNEMSNFKNEMRDFKNEMRDFKNEMKEENKKMNKRWGEISNKLGTIVEDIIYPALRPVISNYFKCELIYMAMNIKKKMEDIKDEIDAIAVSNDAVFVVEVKATPRIDYINEFREKKIDRFKKIFPEYSDKKIVPIFASLRLEEDIIQYLSNNNIYAMAYKEWEYMDILNFDKVKI